MGDRGDVWVKREDLTSTVYGGNKVRTLEAMFGRARAAGATRMWATGAYGSNHAVATVLHARAAGLDGGAILFPQPAGEPALANASALLAARPEVISIGSVIELPFVMARVRRRTGAYVMPPGGATPEGRSSRGQASPNSPPPRRFTTTKHTPRESRGWALPAKLGSRLTP